MRRTAPWAHDDRHTNLIGFARIVLAAIVVWSHSYPLLFGIAAVTKTEPLARLTNGQTDGGSVAVGGFLLLSGYLITLSWGRSSSLLEFFWRRARRIYPGFIIASILSAYLVPRLYDMTSPPADPLITVINLALLRQPVAPGTFAEAPLPEVINGSLWSIQCEFWGYALIALLGTVGILRRPRIVIGCLIAVLAIYTLQIRGFGPLQGPGHPVVVVVWGEPSNYPRLLSCLLAGATFATWRQQIPRTPQLLLIALGMLVLAIPLQILGVILPVAGGYALLYSLYSVVPLLAKIGQASDLSYGLYLYAFPVQQLFVHWRGGQLTPTTLTLATLSVTLPLAWLSWRYIERPCLTLSLPSLVRRTKTPDENTYLSSPPDPIQARANTLP